MTSITGNAIYNGGSTVSNDMANVLSFVDTYGN
jgi:hypothetical protein